MSIRIKDGDLITCYWGVERGPGAVSAFNDAGKNVTLFPGGTHTIQNLPDDEIKHIAPQDGRLHIVYDQGSGQEEWESCQAAMERLQALGIAVDTVDSTSLRIQVYHLGLDPNDYGL